jgi:hypothetical protein
MPELGVLARLFPFDAAPIGPHVGRGGFAMTFRLTAVMLAASLAACGATNAQDVEDQERIIEHDLDRLESRTGDPRQGTIQRRQTETDLSITDQRLRTLKTREPGDEDVPVLERQLDRVQRDAAPRNPVLRSPSSNPVLQSPSRHPVVR